MPRKPKGDISGKRAVFSTRITPETRKALERAAKENNRSLSQEVERRLIDSLKRSPDQPSGLRSLFYFMGLMFREICYPQKPAWPLDPFRARALLGGTRILLEHLLMPKGEPERPKDKFAYLSRAFGEKRATEMLESPERYGAFAMTGLWMTTMQSEEWSFVGEDSPALPHVKRDLFDPIMGERWREGKPPPEFTLHIAKRLEETVKNLSRDPDEGGDK